MPPRYRPAPPLLKAAQRGCYTFLGSGMGAFLLFLAGVLFLHNALYEVDTLIGTSLVQVTKCGGASGSVDLLDTIGGEEAIGDMFSEPIDAVYTWVNGSDPEHQKLVAFWKEVHERLRLAGESAAEEGDSHGSSSNRGISESSQGVGSRESSRKASAETIEAEAAKKKEEEHGKGEKEEDHTIRNRFEDHDEMKYSLRSLETYAKWVRNVYIVTSGQVPSWLDTSNPRVKVVPHSSIFPNATQCLPTFSSPAIESNLHRIPGLSRKFLYLNDDTFFGDKIVLDDFYSPVDGYKLYFAWPVPNCNEGCPASWLRDGFCDASCNVSDCGWDGGDCLGENIKVTDTGGPGHHHDPVHGHRRGGHHHHHRGGGRGSYRGPGQRITSQGGDVAPCSQSCADDWIGDSRCDEGCNVAACGYDATDCGLEKYSSRDQGPAASSGDVETSAAKDSAEFLLLNPLTAAALEKRKNAEEENARLLFEKETGADTSTRSSQLIPDGEDNFKVRKDDGEEEDIASLHELRRHFVLPEGTKSFALNLSVVFGQKHGSVTGGSYEDTPPAWVRTARISQPGKLIIVTIVTKKPSVNSAEEVSAESHWGAGGGGESPLMKKRHYWGTVPFFLTGTIRRLKKKKKGAFDNNSSGVLADSSIPTDNVSERDEGDDEDKYELVTTTRHYYFNVTVPHPSSSSPTSSSSIIEASSSHSSSSFPQSDHHQAASSYTSSTRVNISTVEARATSHSLISSSSLAGSEDHHRGRVTREGEGGGGRNRDDDDDDDDQSLHHKEGVKRKLLAVEESEKEQSNGWNQFFERQRRRGEEVTTKRQLLDTFGDSLKYANLLLTERTVSTSSRRVPAHMVHLIDRQVVNELWKEYPEEFRQTSAAQFRNKRNLQYGFMHYYHVIEYQRNRTKGEIFDKLVDVNRDGIVSKVEVRRIALLLWEKMKGGEGPGATKAIGVLRDMIQDILATNGVTDGEDRTEDGVEEGSPGRNDKEKSSSSSRDQDHVPSSSSSSSSSAGSLLSVPSRRSARDEEEEVTSTDNPSNNKFAAATVERQEEERQWKEAAGHDEGPSKNNTETLMKTTSSDSTAVVGDGSSPSTLNPAVASSTTHSGPATPLHFAPPDHHDLEHDIQPLPATFLKLVEWLCDVAGRGISSSSSSGRSINTDNNNSHTTAHVKRMKPSPVIIRPPPPPPSSTGGGGSEQPPTSPLVTYSMTRTHFENSDIATLLHEYYASYKPYNHVENSMDDVTFIMVRDNLTVVQHEMDHVRTKRPKFLCINDNLNHSHPEYEQIIASVQELLDDYYPTPSQFELPPGQVNPFLHIDEGMRQGYLPKDYLPTAGEEEGGGGGESGILLDVEDDISKSQRGGSSSMMGDKRRNRRRYTPPRLLWGIFSAMICVYLLLGCLKHWRKWFTKKCWGNSTTRGGGGIDLDEDVLPPVALYHSSRQHRGEESL